MIFYVAIEQLEVTPHSCFFNFLLSLVLKLLPSRLLR